MEEERENDAVAAGSSYRMRANNFPQAGTGVSFAKKHLQSKSVSYILNRQSSFPVREDKSAYARPAASCRVFLFLEGIGNE